MGSDVELSEMKGQPKAKASGRSAQAEEDKEKPRQLEMEQGELVPEYDAQQKPRRYCDNRITTSKYTLLTFLPINLYEQLSRPANAYFVIVAILQSIPDFSISQGRPTILLPLIFVLTVSGIKDAVEDHKRHVADAQENDRKFDRLSRRNGGEWERVVCSALTVGDTVQVKDEENFPADLLLLTASAEDGSYCYIETANLDGETNLKIKMVPECAKPLKTAAGCAKLAARLKCDAPCGKLDTFGGLLTIGGKETLLNNDHLLLRGAKLRNTGSIIGLVVYSGEESKIRMNSNAQKRATVKRSTVERTMNRNILGMFGLQVLFCTLAGLGAGMWERNNQTHKWYLLLDEDPATVGVVRFFTWFIIFNGFVPISLLVSMELVKFWQGMFMGWDTAMCANVGGELQFARAQTSGLNEELGQVQYILSDKTGTLTCNSMDFRKCLIGPHQLGSGDTDISKAARSRASFVAKPAAAGPKEDEDESPAELAHHVNFNGGKRLAALLKGQSIDQRVGRRWSAEEGKAHAEQARDFLTSLALCNTVFPTLDDKRIPILKASSPDEEALVEFARFAGYELLDRNPPFIKLNVYPEAEGKTAAARRAAVKPNVLEYEQLALLDFTSKRKRMSIVVRCPNGRIRIYCKGADSLVQPLLRGADQGPQGLRQAQPQWDATLARLGVFGDQGLRTLLVAVGDREASWWDDPVVGWATKYKQGMAACAVEGPAEEGHFKGACKDDCRRCLLEEGLEKASALDLLGATAIEDKLQLRVPETIRQCLQAGIAVWVLTGDKLETAINIGLACNLLESSMERKGNLLRVDSEDTEAIARSLAAHAKHLDSLSQQGLLATQPVGLVITSQALAALLAGPPALATQFLAVATQCKSVVGCRMQPNQKATVVRMVKEYKRVTTLAIGDGANDEQMIRTADVGVGIRGVEGTTAVRAADYAISQFSFLRRLLLVYGRLNLRRIATLICYIFYKTSLSCFTVLWFGLYSGFSGQPLYLEWALQCYNLFFTSAPILVFAVLDRDIEPALLEGTPQIYGLSAHGELFNMRVFWRWMAHSLVHSLLLFFIPLYVFGLPTASDSSGRSDGMWSLGIVVYSAVVIAVNLKLAMLFRSWTWVHQVSLWGSIGLYFVLMIIFNLSPIFGTAGGDYYGLLFALLATPKYYLTVFATVVAALFLDYTIEAVLSLSPHPLIDNAKTEAQAEEEAAAASAATAQAVAAALAQNVPAASPLEPDSPGSRAALLSGGGGSEEEEEKVAELIAANNAAAAAADGPGAAHARKHTGYAFDYTPNESARKSAARLAALAAGEAAPAR